MGLLQSLLHLTNFRNPLLRTLVPSFAAAYAIQGAFAVPSIIAQTERFYDLSGSLTYISVTLLSLYLPALRARVALPAGAPAALPSLLSPFVKSGAAGAAAALNWRQVVLSAAVTFWAVRLGSHLFQRVLSEGKDSRFDNIRGSPSKFAVAFFAQATWVSLCLAPVVAVNAAPAAAFGGASAAVTLGMTDVLGLLLYAGGLAFEVVADRQKSQWVEEKKNKVHDEDFLTRGLWGKCRFPNYFGEISLWTGIATTACGVLVSEPARIALGLPRGLAGPALAVGISYVSPAFVTFLLTKVSGIPLSEDKYDKRYGHRKDYQEWKKNTPRLFPKLS